MKVALQNTQDYVVTFTYYRDGAYRPATSYIAAAKNEAEAIERATKGKKQVSGVKVEAEK